MTALDVARVNGNGELCELLSASSPSFSWHSSPPHKEEVTPSVTTAPLTTDPQKVKEMATPPAPDQKPQTTPSLTTVPQWVDEKSTPPPTDKPQDTPEQGREVLEVRLPPLTHYPEHVQHIMYCRACSLLSGSSTVHIPSPLHRLLGTW